MLTSVDSAEPGLWKTSRTPYLKGVQDELSPRSPVERVVVVSGSQLGKTSAGINWIGFIIHLSPGPILAVQPTIEMAKRFSRQRLDPLFENAPVFISI
jgi:phage terminase large subunit GpA-like protein